MKLVRKLLLSLLACLSAAACFTVSTYAWFQVNSSAKVEGFDFQTTGGLGFLISVDGENYYHNLTSEQMKMAILMGYNEQQYVVKAGQMYDTYNEKFLALEDMNSILKEKLLLYPVTSYDGVKFSSLSGGTITKDSGKFIEFSIYFKATSNQAQDNLSYNIYLCGEDINHSGEIGYGSNEATIPGTHIITKNPDTFNLVADMTVYDGTPEGKIKYAHEPITVHTSNASRLSIKEETSEAAIIYEITNQDDLGSYATNYDSTIHDTSDDVETKKAKDKLYNYKYNAMYTYYNNLRPSAKLKPMEYTKKPNTVRVLSEDNVITNVKSGGEAKKVTFRFWLEGWDADCFDGITQSINVRLLFNSKVVTN